MAIHLSYMCLRFRMREKDQLKHQKYMLCHDDEIVQNVQNKMRMNAL